MVDSFQYSHHLKKEKLFEWHLGLLVLHKHHQPSSDQHLHRFHYYPYTLARMLSQVRSLEQEHCYDNLNYKAHQLRGHSNIGIHLELHLFNHQHLCTQLCNR